VAIENISDLHEPVILSKEIFHDLFSANASMAGFLPDEEVPAIDCCTERYCLPVLMLQSDWPFRSQAQKVNQ
jgi:hypothetical protein